MKMLDDVWNDQDWDTFNKPHTEEVISNSNIKAEWGRRISKHGYCITYIT
jgi:hypothetical protein